MKTQFKLREVLIVTLAMIVAKASSFIFGIKILFGLTGWWRAIE